MRIEGIFAVDKPIGITSQRAVQIVKYWAKRKTGNKKMKVGHAGTLDPLASGVLVVAVGRENTKKLDKVVESEKEYLAEITLGETSSTDDAEGEKKVINKKLVPSDDDVKLAVERFVGDITQTPSVYSAIKIDGEEAYKRARRGEEVEMKERVVHIEQIEIISYEYPVIKIRVECGKGTYIRSLARDIGDTLGTGGFLSSLRRTRVGDFDIVDSHDLKEFSMRIAIHASELDGERIDGTKVYISEVLNRLGDMAREDDFIIYHKDEFNKSLIPPKKDNYHIKTLANMPFWTQTRFAWDIWRERPNVLWVPLHNMPFVHNKKTKIIITVHDLAFKIFPETFPAGDVRKLNFLTDRAVKKADHIITVSKSTKRDLLKFYPQLKTDKITVVHLGMNTNDWQKEIKGDVVRKALMDNGIGESDYIISVGAIQPRKNLKVLIDAFAKIKDVYPDMKLVLVGGNGWMWQDTHECASKSKYVDDIIFTGGISFLEVQILMQRAQVFVFPTLYEGFGIGGLEALAAGVPVVAAKNSSLPEVLGDAAIYFDANNFKECATNVLKIMEDKELKQHLISAGLKRIKKFSWDKCAKKTLCVLRQ